jgi:hypothetical protein
MVTADSQVEVGSNWGWGSVRRCALVEIYRVKAIDFTRKDA